MLQFKAKDMEQNKSGRSSDNSSSGHPGRFFQVPTVATSTVKGDEAFIFFFFFMTFVVVVVAVVKLLNHYMVCIFIILYYE